MQKKKTTSAKSASGAKPGSKSTPKAPRKAVAKSSTWDFLGDNSFARNAAEALGNIRAKNSSTDVSDLSKFEHSHIKFPEFGLQATFGMTGLPYGTIMDIIAPDGVGKTSLLLTMLGWFMQQGSPCYYVETENKLMAPARIKRCLSTDRALAQRLYDHLVWDQCFEIQTAIRSMEEFITKARTPDSGMFVPQHIPLVIALDTFSKLMSAGEAEDVVVGKGEVGETKEVGGGQTMAAAMAAQAWMRRLPWWQNHYNVIYLFARHQNDKVDMSSKPKFGGGSMTGNADSFNRTSRGGRAFNQNASLQVILTRIQAVSAKVNGVDEKVGEKVLLTVCKNSYGPGGKKFFYQINTVHRTDTETYQEPAITFAPYTAEWSTMMKIIPGITMKNKNCITCRELEIYDGTAEEFSKALHANQPLLGQISTRLGIFGAADSTSVPDSVTEQLEMSAARPPGPEADAQTTPEDPESQEAQQGGQDAEAAND